MARSPALTGILFAIGGTLIFSVNDVSIKFLSGGYALHQVILIRAFVAMAFILVVIGQSERGFGQLATSRPITHLVRVCIVMVSNLTYFTGLAALPLADAAAVDTQDIAYGDATRSLIEQHARHRHHHRRTGGHAAA